MCLCTGGSRARWHHVLAHIPSSCHHALCHARPQATHLCECNLCTCTHAAPCAIMLPAITAFLYVTVCVCRYSADGSLLVAAKSPYLFTSTDDGLTWTENIIISADLWSPSNYHSITGSPDGQVLGVAERGHASSTPLLSRDRGACSPYACCYDLLKPLRARCHACISTPGPATMLADDVATHTTWTTHALHAANYLVYVCLTNELFGP